MFLGKKIKVAEFCWLGFILLATLMVGCGDDGAAGLAGPAGPAGDEGPAGPQGPEGTVEEAGETAVLNEEDDLPGVDITITDVSAGGGGNALKAGRATRAFESGDTLSVTFRCRYGNGDALSLSYLDGMSILISGPTTNYQRVLPRERDVSSFNIVEVANGVRTINAVRNDDGTWTYTLPEALPATYSPPLYDTAKFTDGELTGQPLQAGTYTIALRAHKNYLIKGVSHRDARNIVRNFVIGDGDAEPREVVKTANCNLCHVTLQAHGGGYRDVRVCVLCHTAGSEDRNSTDENDATPQTIEFSVMIHKIHNGAHLPSVLGVATNVDGTRNYAAPPVPYEVGGRTVHDYSTVNFPVWPNLNIAMPRDQGFSALAAANQTLENTIRYGVTACEKCHGDPDGGGPLAAPAQGGNAYSELTRKVCASCHDDWDPALPYTSNGQTMNAQANDAACDLCHIGTGNGLDVEVAHVHPLLDPAINTGLNFDITAVAEAGVNDGDGTIDAGEKVSVTFSLKDDAGANVNPANLGTGISAIISGPTSNLNLVQYSTISKNALGATADTYTLNFPQPIFMELVGVATGGADVLNTALTPIWTTHTTVVYERTATGGGDTTLATATGVQNYIDVDDATGFAANDYVVIDDDLGTEEYFQVSRVDGNRLWLYSPYSTSDTAGSTGTPNKKPGLQFAHDAGAQVLEVTLTRRTQTTAWAISNAANGEITLVAGQFTNGNKVIVTYMTDFVMPEGFPVTLCESPDQDETWGKWTGKSIVSGTYMLSLWSYRTINVNPLRVVVGAAGGDDITYRGTSPEAYQNFLVGDATTEVPYALISSGENCYTCHSDVFFHGGGRRGFVTCIMCHGLAGAEDAPRYVYAVAPDNGGLTVNFRTMLHKIHMGEELTNADTYAVAGYQGNQTTFEEVVFPAMPDKAKKCASCHGSDNEAWMAPSDRNHPTEQNMPVRGWNAVCGSCHDSEIVAGHIDAQTGPTTGIETCELCHGEGKAEKVELKHKVR